MIPHLHFIKRNFRWTCYSKASQGGGKCKGDDRVLSMCQSCDKFRREEYNRKDTGAD